MTAPVATIIIPAYNRTGPLAATLASALRTCQRLGDPAEVILVDDGSAPPLTTLVPAHPLLRIIPQVNQGSIVARSTGLAAARGEFVLFLDSDDLIADEKLLRHVTALRRDATLVATYDDVGALVDPANPASPIHTTQHLAGASGLPELLLRVQPPPHGCVFRREFLVRALARPIVAPDRSLDAVGDVWLYYNLVLFPGPVAKINAPLSLIGIHDLERYSQSWERLGCAALRLVERFMAATASATEPATHRARLLAGEVAFASWRRLPRDFSPEFSRRQLALWRQAPRGPLTRLGGPLFRTLALLLGPANAGRLLRLRNGTYASCRTVDDPTLARLLSA
jgi:hypothetical protein